MLKLLYQMGYDIEKNKVKIIKRTLLFKEALSKKRG